jgi:enolase-phosphatase E1
LASLFNSVGIHAILLDIEGTTTPIDFVSKQLFPFASARVEDFLQRNSGQAEIGAVIEELRAASQRDHGYSAGSWASGDGEQAISGAAAYVRWLIAKDSKITPLKTLQGKIWEEGYRSGELKGGVYPDVAPALARWKKQGQRIAIFSSGSVLAQKLLFAHSTAGDLTSFLDAYFDTATGPKREAASYQKIAAALHLKAERFVFVSDVEAELDAARAAGMRTLLSLRPGVRVPEKTDHPVIKIFD